MIYIKNIILHAVVNAIIIMAIYSIGYLLYGEIGGLVILVIPLAIIIYRLEKIR